MDHDDSIEVRKNEARSRYELIANGRIAGIADYRAG